MTEYTAKKVLLKNVQGEFLIPYTEPTPSDKQTITLNDNNELQAVGIQSKDGSLNNFWVGSSAEYQEALAKGIITADTLCHITDDAESALFNVDGTTIEFSEEGILRVPSNVDLMDHEEQYDNGAGGVRKTRNGYMEQWGIATSSTSGAADFEMHEAYKDTNYSVFVTIREMGNFFIYALPSGVKKFNCRVRSSSGVDTAVKFQWRAFGFYK